MIARCGLLLGHSVRHIDQSMQYYGFLPYLHVPLVNDTESPLKYGCTQYAITGVHKMPFQMKRNGRIRSSNAKISLQRIQVLKSLTGYKANASQQQ